MSIPRACAAATMLSLVACGSEEPSTETEPAPRPNILFVSIDSLRRDLVGAYGYESPHAPGLSSSPSLDALARDGVLFERAHATSSWTLPSHLAMLTGSHELLHGVDLDDQLPDPDRRTIAELLSEAGYRTAGFFSGPYLEPHFGFGRGFDRYEACYGPELASASARVTELTSALDDEGLGAQERESLAAQLQDARVAEEETSHIDSSSEKVTDALLSELSTESDRPLFLFAHFFDPHYDYVPPPPFDSRFDPAYQGPMDGLGFYNDTRISTPAEHPWARNRVASDRDMEHIRALYAGELSWVDAQIARILEELESRGMADNTLVIVTSDHGDEFFEHGSLGHRHTLFQEITAVPMIVRWPGKIPAGRREPAIVSTADLVPTILDWLELPSSGQSGQSFAALLAGEDDGSARAALSRMVVAWRSPIRVTGADGQPELRPSKLIVVTETWRRGDIKVTRQRQWPEMQVEDLPAANRRAFREQRTASRAAEILYWIDLASDPSEASSSFSGDFRDPRAAAALDGFQREYVRLSAARSTVAGSRDNSAFGGRLGALGYASGSGGPEPTATRDLVLPAPGRN